jgi:hypothetical protein
MTAYPYRMPRPGGPRPAGLLAAVMLLFVLVGTVLSSAGAAHLDASGEHHHHAVLPEQQPAPAAHDHSGEPAPAQGHQHRTDAAPHLTPRARPAADAVLVSTLPAEPASARSGVAHGRIAVAFSDADLSLLGVLRL